MRILFDINHPSHVHTFKHVLYRLSKEGHTCFISARNKDITHQLLAGYSIPYFSTGKTPASTFGKAVKSDFTVWRIIRVILRQKVDVAVSMESPYAVLAAWICRRRSITLTDTETAETIHRITGPLSTTVLVPTCFYIPLKESQMPFSGYKELAYLHPDHFTPDHNLMEHYAIAVDRPFAILRFVSFHAMHDKNHEGFSDSCKILLVASLSAFMQVFVSSESRLPDELKPYKLDINPVDMHDLLARASLFAGDSITMAAEAAVLGIPTICLTGMDVGYILELTNIYRLIHRFPATPEGQLAAIDKALAISGQQDAKAQWQTKRRAMLEEKINVADYLVDFIKGYE